MHTLDDAGAVEFVNKFSCYGSVFSSKNQFGLAGDEEVLFGLAVDLRQFMGAESEEYLECCNATVMLVGRLMALTIDHGEYIFTQTPLNKFYRTLELSGLNEFADTIDGETIRRHRLIERLLGFADDLCEMYSGRRPLSHYYESDAELFYACRDVHVDACKGYRPNERIPIGDGPYGTGVYGPEGKPDDGEDEEVKEAE